MFRRRTYHDRKRSCLGRFIGAMAWLVIEIFFWSGLILAPLIRDVKKRNRVIRWLDGIDIFAFLCWEDGIYEAIEDRRRGGL